jgi:hypothetical protein
MKRTEEKRAAALADEALAIGFEDAVQFMGTRPYAVVLRDGTDVLVPITNMSTTKLRGI